MDIKSICNYLCSKGSSGFSYEKALACDKSVQSVVVDDDSKDCDSGKPRRLAVLSKSKDGLISFPFPEFDNGKGCRTLWDGFRRGLSIGNKCLGGRRLSYTSGRKELKEFVWLTYSEAADEMLQMTAGLFSLGVTECSPMGICANNRVEWTMTFIGLGRGRFPVVALYDSYGPAALEYIVVHSGMSTIFCSRGKLPMIMELCLRAPEVKYLVLYDTDPRFGNTEDTVEPEFSEECKKMNITLLGFSDLKSLGREYIATNGVQSIPEPQPADVSHIMYTSGTTGKPKGVVLTHGSMMASASSALYQPLANRTIDDRYMSYLPLAHILENSFQICMLCLGAGIGFYSGDVKYLNDDLFNLKPTVFPGVPRVFVRLYDKVVDGVNSMNFIKRAMFNFAFTQQAEQLRKGLPLHAMWDKKIFAMVRQKMGLDKCELIVSGAAPLSPPVAEFLMVTCPAATVIQAYGTTETGAAICSQLLEDRNLGHVGPPLSCNDIKLRDVPEMGYMHTDKPERGEILVRGPNVFKEYYKDEENTKTTIDEFGWYSTGDVGRWNPNGTLSIIDRKKNIFKLAQGEYISSEKVEAVYTTCSLVSQIWIYGSSFKPFLLAVVVPDPSSLLSMSKSKGWNAIEAELGTLEFVNVIHGLIKTHYKTIKETILGEMREAALKNKLNPLEVPRDIHIESRLSPDAAMIGFTVANECVTPTFKLRRPFLFKRYKDVLYDLYADNGAPIQDNENWDRS